MNNLYDYQQSLNTLHFTPEQKAALAARSAEAAEAAQPVRRRKPVWRTAAIAAALAAVLAVGAGATGVLKSAAEAFAPLFGGAVAQTEIIDKIGRPIGASDTDNGVTITADAIIGDPYNACIIYTISRDDGAPLLPEGLEARSLLAGGTGGADIHILGGIHGSAWFVDEDPADNALQMVQTLSADRPLMGTTATAEFNGLFRWDDTAGTSVPVVDGHWKFRFDVDYGDASVALGGGETFRQDGITFTVDAVTVSPVAVTVDYTADSAVVWSNAESGRQSEEDSRQMARYLENVEILLTRTDGTVINLSGAGGSLKPQDGTTVCSKSCVLEELLPLEELESISVGGVVYSLSGT